MLTQQAVDAYPASKRGQARPFSLSPAYVPVFTLLYILHPLTRNALQSSRYWLFVCCNGGSWRKRKRKRRWWCRRRLRVEMERERAGTAHSAVEALQSCPATVIKSGGTTGSTVRSQPGPTTTTSTNRAGNRCYGGVANFFSSCERFGIQFFLLTLIFYVTVFVNRIGGN